jgi:hypothetical protein
VGEDIMLNDEIQLLQEEIADLKYKIMVTKCAKCKVKMQKCVDILEKNLKYKIMVTNE